MRAVTRRLYSAFRPGVPGHRCAAPAHFRRGSAIVVVLALLAPGVLGASNDPAASQLATTTLAPTDGLTPQDFGSATLDALEYADPTEALSIIDAPVPNNDGSVELSYPLGLPPGHGITPELTVQYGSGGGNGWLGTGWDLGVGEITIDTAFGAPHFSADSESESYLLDGDLLVPNANDDAWEPRLVGDRSDFTRQVENDFDEIIRHQVVVAGEPVWPADYFWEVRSKDGSVKWYGGTPDSGGPAPRGAAPTIDESAVVRNEAGHIVSWLLSAQRDIGVNLIRYEYETLIYGFDGEDWIVDDCVPAAELCGQHTYLDRILYTDATSGIADRNGPPYEIDLLRESEPVLGNSADAARPDPIVDAGLGYVDVVADRLGRVEVKWGAPPASGMVRTYNTIAARYEFTYGVGRFGKSLLTSIIQGVDDPHTHLIEYFDELTDTADGVDGFGTLQPDGTRGEDWATQADTADVTFLDTTADVSTLGGSETNGGSGNIYIGFNPITPSKTLSFGVGLELSGSDTEALAEWIDLNGDGLPDKVFFENGVVKFRINQTGPGGSGAWTEKDEVEVVENGSSSGLDTLSRNSNFGFQVSVEAYPLVALGLGTGLGFSWTNTYFSDVNGDGLVDFVNGGKVYFNSLNSAGVPTFRPSSDLTPIPLEPSALPTISSTKLTELSEQLSIQSPPIDTVRRFIAPFSGSLSISAPVALPTAGVDGVRVAIQHNGTEFAFDTLDTSGEAAFAAPVVRSVEAGDNIYFRVGAIDDGVDDAVTWSPVMTYQSPGWPEFDANGLSQWVYSAADDFTLAGRPNDFIAMPNTGTASVVATVELAEALTDDVRVVVVKRSPDDGDADVLEEETVTVLGTILAGAADLSYDFIQPIDVALTEQPDPADPTQINVVAEKLSVYLSADSPVDLADIDFASTITYATAVDANGDPIPVVDADGQPVFEHHVRPHVEVYGYADLTEGADTSPLSGDNDVVITVRAGSAAPAELVTVGAVITVKSSNGLEQKVETTLAVTGDTATTTAPVNLDGVAANSWVELMIRDNTFARDGLTLERFATVDGAAVETPVDNVVLRWSGMQGIFPQPYRGWGIAGYTAGDNLGSLKIEESAFVIDTASYPTEEPTRDDVSLDEANTEPSYAYISAVAPGGGTTADPVATDRWVGARANLYGDATTLRTSRLAVDSVDFSSITAPSGAGGRTAPTRLGISGPGLTLSFGIGPLGASAGLSPSFGLTDFEDLNGDGYPDVISTGSVTYTDQRGQYLDSQTVDRTSVTNQDLTISINGGLSAGMVDIQPNTKGSANAVDGDAAGKGSSASDAGPSFSLGISGSGGFSWTSPNASFDDDPSGGTYGEQIGNLQGDFDADTSEIQRSFADVNGDGLPDSVYTNASGVFAYYNLGYGFTAHAVQLGTGGFESRESATGGAGLGFSLPYGEFGGGVNLLFNYDWATFSWKDVNGDGILDQIRRASPTQVRIGFGTGSGVLPEIDYGDLYSVPVSPGIDGGQHISFDRASGIGGGVSATAYIGPLCLVACYLVIGGGGGYNNSRSSSSADLDDVNGDGFADALLSLNDDRLSVKLNQQGRTNLLKSVSNPMGGSFTVDYERVGNTTDHPDSIWVMNRVDIFDGRSTTGGHYASTVDYDGLLYDRTHRSSLGFNRVTITELDTETIGEPPMRINEQQFLNDNVFVRGLMFAAAMYEPDGSGGRIDIRGSEVTWGLRDLRVIAADFDAQAPADLIVPTALGDVQTVASRGRSIAPLVVEHEEFWFDGDRVFPKSTTFEYDGLGNVIVENDLGAPDDDYDDLITTIEYSSCLDVGVTGNGCLPQSSPRQPLWSPGMCINWASFPTRVSVHGVDDAGDPVLLRERVSPIKMCDNGVPTVLDELVSTSGANPTYATSNLTVNQYGDYELVMAPPNADGIRYTVRYTYDADRHSDIANVEEFDVTTANAEVVLASGPSAGNSTAGISSSATFDPLSGRADSRTDANDATRSYVFDEHGRIVSTSTMATPGNPSTALITYEYNANDPDYGYAIARHVDPANGNDPDGQDDSTGGDTTATLDTITFVDGLGRVRQTKRDGRLSVEGGAPVNTRQVSDGVEFDVLARPIVQYGPTADPGPADTFSPDAVNGVQTQTSWFSYDLRESVTEPGNRTTTYNYPWETVEDGGPLFAFTDAIDPEGRLTRIAQDVRDVQRYHVDVPAPRVDADGNEIEPPPALETAYAINSIGELLHVIDSTGAVTSYEYDLRGLNTLASTPNGGTVRYTYDLAGNKQSMINDDMAALDLQTSYGYEFNRLVGIDHPGTVDDVTYEYGMDNSDGRFTAGRVSHITDRTHLVDNTYDSNGAMVEQTAIIKRHNWRPGLTPEELIPFTYTTGWTYDDLGRITTVRYPDSKTVSYVPAGQSVAGLPSPADLPSLLETADLLGEIVSYAYDSGGLLQGVTGAEEGLVTSLEQILTVDEFGNPVSIPISVPRRTTHEYAYLNDRVYDPRLLAVRDEMGNGTVSEYSFDAETRWLDSKRTTTDPNPDPAVATPLEIQDLSYTYDLVGRPLTYQNARPLANRPINGGGIESTFTYDGFGRLRTSSGTFDLKAGEQQRYTYQADFEPSAPWSVTFKDQYAALVSGTGNKARTKVDDNRTYSFDREFGTAGGPLQVVSDALTVNGQPTKTYDYDYNANGDILSMLTPKVPTTTTAPPLPTTTTVPKGKPKPPTTTTTVPVASETNVWDRVFTWTLMNQLTSASDGSELRTFAYDDTGTLMIQDGNLLDRDGDVIAQHGGGPETIFLNPWVLIRSQKIYKYIRDGVDSIATKMDSGAAYETKQMFIHTDLVGSTNAVSDDQGRGFQRHEYFPSGEIWIIDHKEEIRTPFQFGDGYYEDEFDIILFRARWYDTERELFLSPDPLLSTDVQSLIGQPSLGGAYTYAGANAVGNVDPSGLEFFGAHSRVDVKARAQAAFDLDQVTLINAGEGDAAKAKLNLRISLLKSQEAANTIREPNALIKIDLRTGEVSLGAPYGPRKTWKLKGGDTGSQAPAVDDAKDDSSPAADDSADATNGSGGPSAGSDGASPGSATVDVADGDADDAKSTDDSPADQPPPPSPQQQGAAGPEDGRVDQ